MKLHTRALSIRSRLIIMLLTVSSLAAFVLIYIGYQNGKQAITQGAFNQLKGIRASKQYQIETYFRETEGIVEIMADNRQVADALNDFKAGYKELNGNDLQVNCRQELSVHYEDFVERLSENMDVKPSVDLYYPTTKAACYLQYEYIVNNKNGVGQKHLLNDAGDRSKYSDFHRRHHKFLSGIVTKFGFYDLFLVDLETGDIVYSVYKETDFATNLYSGPYRESNLAVLARQLRENRDIDRAQIIDFKSYRPSYGAPASFIGRTVTDGSETTGAVIIQLPIDEVNKIMTGNGNWEEDGLGESGETYLVGEDYLMRSVSRFYLQDTVGFKKALSELGTDEQKVDLMYRVGTTILQQRVKTEAVEAALSGKKAVEIVNDYRGEPVLSAYAPLQIRGLKWAILSEIDEAEADRPIERLKRKIFIAVCIITLIVTFAAMYLASVFVKPIEKLTNGVRKLREGDFSSRIEVEGNDEFSELGKQFNKMVSDIDAQQQEIEKHSLENERLMLNFIPQTIVARLQKGEKNIADKFSNVTLIAIDVVGFSELASKIGARDSVILLNNLTDAFDTAGKKHYVEKLRTIGDTYFAACGLFSPRLDHAKRVVEFAKEAKLIIGQFNINHQLSLSLEFGIHSGEVTAGIIGTEKFNYDLFGETVNGTFLIKDQEIKNAVLVSDAVYERTHEFFEYQKLATPVSKSGVESIWMYKNDKGPGGR